MFTGIIETTARVTAAETAAGLLTLVMQRPAGWELQIGQSIAVNGVCLTAVSFDELTFTTELMTETLQRTTFGTVIPQVVNLERAMLPTDRFEGHIVQGHCDTTGVVQKRTDDQASTTLTLSFSQEYADWVVPKGSIAVDGVSLTVVDCGSDWLSVALIPHTLQVTILQSLSVGDAVNLEFDIISKYITKKHH